MKILEPSLAFTDINYIIHVMTIYTKLLSNAEFTLEDFSFITVNKWFVLVRKWAGLKENIYKQVTNQKVTTNEENLSKVSSINLFNKLDTIIKNTNENGLDTFYNLSEQKKYASILRLIPLSNMEISSYENSLINDYIKKVSNLTITDFQNMKDKIDTTLDKLYDTCGKNNSIYDEYAGRSKFPAQISFKESHISIINILMKLRNQIIDFLYDKIEEKKEKKDTELVIKIPYNTSLQEIAYMYYGDASKWVTIAEFNQLKYPYVDDEGIRVLLLSNGAGNLITVEYKENIQLDLNEYIYLNNDNKIEEKRKIINIINNKSSGYYEITLDGISDLSKYTLQNHSYFILYSPHTTNYKKEIIIPNVLGENSIIDVNDVDLKVNESNDLIFNEYGDLETVEGTLALFQSANILLKTEKGSNIYHPSFGTPNLTNIVNNSDNIEEDLTNSLDTSLTKDIRFSGISPVQIAEDNSTVQASYILFAKSGIKFPIITSINK